MKIKNAPEAPMMNDMSEPGSDPQVQYQDHEVEDALHTIKKAKRLKHKPGLLKEVKKLARKERDSLDHVLLEPEEKASLKGLRSTYNQKYGKEPTGNDSSGNGE
jgi:hypothetical protein